MSEATEILVEASVDYLTVTAQSNKASGALMNSLFVHLTPAFVAESPKKPWKFMGYSGYALDGVRYGINSDKAIVMLSGHNATAMWATVAPSRTRCTRIDLAVTVTLPEARKGLAVENYAEVLQQANKYGTVIQNTRGGQTLYIGSRTSEQYGRLYDKSAEQGNKPGLSWRYEVETKKPRSEAVVVQLLKSNSPKIWIHSYVYNWFYARGILPIFTPGIKLNAIEISARVSSTDQTLKWLSSSVRPSIQRLLDAGKEEQVYVALGLPIKE